MPDPTPLALEDLEGPDKGIWDLVRTNPPQTDFIREGAGHLRGLKNTIRNSFPNVNAFVTATDAELNATAQIAPLETMRLGMVGAVMGFQHDTAMTGWLYCDGQVVSRTEYAELFARIGVTYGAGDGSTTFSVPDMRGYFLRGVGRVGSFDNNPDRASRAARADGTSGDAHGTTENDAFRSHTHPTPSHLTSAGGFTVAGAGGSLVGRGQNPNNTGGNETRPFNRATRWHMYAGLYVAPSP